jgi:hypothetical protein
MKKSKNSVFDEYKCWKDNKPRPVHLREILPENITKKLFLLFKIRSQHML